MSAPRKPLTKLQFARLAVEQEGRCGCGCGQKLDFAPKQVRDEHLAQRALGGSEDLSNRSLWRLECTKPKDARDAKARAKVRRLTGANKPKFKKKIQSRGFQTNLKKKFDGSVVAR